MYMYCFDASINMVKSRRLCVINKTKTCRDKLCSKTLKERRLHATLKDDYVRPCGLGGMNRHCLNHDYYNSISFPYSNSFDFSILIVSISLQ
jgi:hypothetical protein